MRKRAATKILQRTDEQERETATVEADSDVTERELCSSVLICGSVSAVQEKDNHPSVSVNAASIAAAVRRLGKNIGGYFGETIAVETVIAEQRQFALTNGWQIDVLPARPGVELLAFRREVSHPEWRIYISAGIHGDEPAGPLAVRELLKENEWPVNANVWICPCLNPTGFPLRTRAGANGVDLNRDYRDLRTEETRAHVSWLERQPDFDLCLCLHEDWEAQGFYVYELNPEQRPSLAAKIIEAVRRICPIDYSALIDGREAAEGIIRPILNPALRPDWPEALYLITHKTRLNYTLESPSDFPLTARVAALTTAVKSAIN